MYFGPVNASALINCIQAIALREPVFECSRLRDSHLSNRTITTHEFSGGCSAMDSGALITYPFPFPSDFHARMKVRQVIGEARTNYGPQFCRIQAKEIDARLLIPRHVSPHIDLWKVRKPRYRRETTPSNSGNLKRHHAKPGLTVKRIER